MSTRLAVLSLLMWEISSFCPIRSQFYRKTPPPITAIIHRPQQTPSPRIRSKIISCALHTTANAEISPNETRFPHRRVYQEAKNTTGTIIPRITTPPSPVPSSPSDGEANTDKEGWYTWLVRIIIFKEMSMRKHKTVWIPRRSTSTTTEKNQRSYMFQYTGEQMELQTFTDDKNQVQSYTFKYVEQNELQKMKYWINAQLEQVRFMVEGKSSRMTYERAKTLILILVGLESVGIVIPPDLLELCTPERQHHSTTPAAHVSIQERWETSFLEIRSFQQREGHCDVPQKYPPNPRLGKWVNKQRTEYTRSLKGEKSSLTPDRLAKLNSVHFRWRKKRGSSSNWALRLEKLRSFRDTHGHCDVPKNYARDLKLRTWCESQRTQYKRLEDDLFVDDGATSMTKERIEALEGLGFRWGNRNESWEHYLDLLREYKGIHGDCGVPQKCAENPKLGRWVNRQRSEYKQFIISGKKKKSFRSSQRVALLEELGFNWGGQKRQLMWNERFEELVGYKKEHNDCLVPSTYPPNLQLTLWVRTQRYQYKLKMKGDRSSLTDKRIKMLDEIDFVWNVYRGEAM